MDRRAACRAPNKSATLAASFTDTSALGTGGDEARGYDSFPNLEADPASDTRALAAWVDEAQKLQLPKRSLT